MNTIILVYIGSAISTKEVQLFRYNENLNISIQTESNYFDTEEIQLLRYKDSLIISVQKKFNYFGTEGV